MNRRIVFYSLIVPTAAMAVGVLLAQSVLATIGTTEKDARDVVRERICDAQIGLMSFADNRVELAMTAFKKLPVTTQASVTTQLYAWAKAYVSAPAFQADYAKYRASRKPQASIYDMTEEQELKAKIDQQNAEQEASFKRLEAAGRKDTVATMRKQWPETRDQMIPAWRNEIHEQRTKDKEGYDQGLKEWTERYPLESSTVVAKYLREFVAATPDVDFKAKRHAERGEGMDAYAFDNPAYNAKPWQWRLACEFSPEAIAAARAAAQAWLKEKP